MDSGFVRRWLEQIRAYLRRGEVVKTLEVRLESPDPRQQLRDLWSPEALEETSVITALSFGEYLYDVAHIDPTVLEGMDFARSMDLSNLSIFAWLATLHESLDEKTKAGGLAQLSGYVGERFIALELREQGHQVAFPGNPNQAGYDLLVDGQPFQVKVVKSASAVREHLERYPDIPVLVNAELADEVGHLDGVYVTGISHTAVREATEETLARGADLVDFEIPWISGIVAGVREGRRALQGEIDLLTVGSKVASILIGRTAGASIGQFVGPTVGSLLFGPAGFLVFRGLGALVGSHLGRTAALRGLAHLRSRALEEATRELALNAAAQVPRKIDLHQQRASEVASKLAGGSAANEEVCRYLRSQAEEEVRYLASLQEQLTEVADHPGHRDGDIQQRIQHVLRLIRRAAIHPSQLQASLKHLSEAVQGI